jgi:hypothetical protein
MDSQGQEGAFNMDACWACVEKGLSHIESGAAERCSNKTELVSFAVL